MKLYKKNIYGIYADTSTPTYVYILPPSLTPSLLSSPCKLLIRLFSDQHAHTPIAHHEQHRENHRKHPKRPAQIIRVRVDGCQVFSPCGEAEAPVAVADVGAGEGTAVVEDDVAEADGLEGGNGIGEGGAVVQPFEVGGD